MKTEKARRILRSTGLAFSAVLLIVAIAFTIVAPNFGSMLNGFASGNRVKVTDKEIAKTNEAAHALALQVQRESTVLLESFKVKVGR